MKGRPMGMGKRRVAEPEFCRKLLALRLSGLPWQRVCLDMGVGVNTQLSLRTLALELACVRQYQWIVDEVAARYSLTERQACMLIGEAAVDAESARAMCTGDKSIA